MRPTLLAAAAMLALSGCATAQGAADFLAGDPGIREGRGYLAAAAASDQFEIQSSQLALAQAQHPEVRAFAQRLVEEHSKTAQQLAVAAQASGISSPPPPALSGEQQRMLAQLQQAAPGSFDQLYLQQQVPVHQAALRLHHNYALGGEERELRRAAASAVAIVQRHLDEIERIAPPRRRTFFDYF